MKFEDNPLSRCFWRHQPAYSVEKVAVLIQKPSGNYFCVFDMLRQEDAKLCIVLTWLCNEDGDVPQQTVEISGVDLRRRDGSVTEGWAYFYERCFKMTEGEEFIRIIDFGSPSDPTPR